LESFGEQAGGTALPDPPILDQDDQSITEASTYSLESFGEQASGSTALPDPPILGQDDQAIIS
jgi:hypothetical protein